MPDDLKGGFKIYAYNKGQMIIPRRDQVFGSYNMILPIPKRYIGEGYCLYKDYELRRTRWITLDERHQRCDYSKTAAKTTECVTQYLEQEIGCSMGLLGGNQGTRR